jgi:hypothetical protein
VPPEEFDPLSYETFADAVVRALLGKLTVPLGALKRFEGAGVYAVFYRGNVPCYRLISGREIPIYVGQAIPEGGRKGGKGLGGVPGDVLHRRLRDHAKSIQQAKNLQLEDFSCRYLVVVPVWVSVAEEFLLKTYRPVWNHLLDGFGNHDPGKGRYDQENSLWDTLRVGRPWASKLRPRTESPDAIASRVAKFLDDLKVERPELFAERT